MREYLAYLSVERGSSQKTIEAYRRDILDYQGFLEKRGVADVALIVRDDIVGYEADLIVRGYAPASIERHISALKGFHRFLVREGRTESNPAVTLRLPKVPSTLPDVLSIEQADMLLSQPFDTQPQGVRNRAMLEVLYGCGLRVSELVGLDLASLFLDEGFLRVIGKGNKERIVPVSGMAARALASYLEDGRPLLVRPYAKPTSAVFLNTRGGRLTRQSVHAVVASAGLFIGVANLHPHTLRHSFATHMLEG
ncbi:MAG: tyrosine-type recombinase/integrase, partial [Eggerthellaceae bacterium]|nr:tyrosine-type recombinase/integrase [Eggerthellaceae bacterium]